MIEEHSETGSWLARYADRLTRRRTILARLPDDVFQLAYAALFDGDEIEDLPPYNDEDIPEWQAQVRSRMRRNEPALNSLSDEELDVAFAVVMLEERDEFWKIMKYLAATGRRPRRTK